MSCSDALDSWQLERAGRAFRCSTHPDYVDIVAGDAGDYLGQLEWPERDSCTGHYRRPEHFTGAAHLLGYGRSFERIWWEPPTELRSQPEQLQQMRSHVLELLEWGYVWLSVELLRDGDRDAYGAPIVERSASLGALEAMDDEYQRSCAVELADELLAELGADATA